MAAVIHAARVSSPVTGGGVLMGVCVIRANRDFKLAVVLDGEIGELVSLAGQSRMNK